MAEPFSLTVLGASGSYPGPGGACSGYLVQAGTTNIWLDAGSGTLANLQEHIAITDIDAVILTHEHVDHWTDVEHLAVANRWILGRTGLPVYAQVSLPPLLRVGIAADSIDWRGIGPDTRVSIGEASVLFSLTDHSVPTLAVRIDFGGRSIGYSSDTGPGWSLEQLGPGLDLALVEATYLSDREGSLPHLSARQAGTTAQAAGARRLVITHLWASTDPDAARAEAELAFGGRVEVARVGERYVV